MKDEGPYVLEYVAHPRVMGLERICIASNDCSDGTDALLDALAQAGAIAGHHRSVLRHGDRPQRTAFAAMRARWDLDRAGWLMVLDADEFLNVTTGEGALADLIAAAPADADLIALNALSFGTDDDPAWTPGRVTRRFTRRLPATAPANGRVQCLIRRLADFDQIQNHCPAGFRPARGLRVMRGDGSLHTLPRDVPLYTLLRHVPAEHIRHGLAHYNHYPIKSVDSFLLRRERGRGTVPVGGQGTDRWTEAYWARFAAARIEDRGILDRHDRAVQAEMARWLTDPLIAAAQADTERRHAALLAAAVQRAS